MFPKKIITLYTLIILMCLALIYIFFNSQQATDTQHFKILNTLDILHQLHSNANRNKNNSTIFDLRLIYNLAPISCERGTQILIIITSHLHNIETRSAMRRTINTTILDSLSVRRVFLLGSVILDPTISQAAIENESVRFKDILQGSFIEDYRNLTYKHMMGLKWAADQCAHSKYVIKMDDDIVIDLRRVVQYLKAGRLKNVRDSMLLAGYVLKNMVPKREPLSKWYVTQEEYSEDSYPTFLSGWFYITNPETAKLMVLASKIHKYFWIDDTLITGILARILQITHIDLAQYFALHSEFIGCCIDDYIKHHFECPFFVGPNGGDANLFVEFNKAMEHCSVDLCVKRNDSIYETCIRTKMTNLGEGKSASIERYKLF